MPTSTGSSSSDRSELQGANRFPLLVERMTSTVTDPDMPQWAVKAPDYSAPAIENSKHSMETLKQNGKFDGKKSLGDTVKQTAVEFTQSGSLHGMQYIFESGKRLLSSRVIWTALVLIATVVGIVWSVQAYEDWQDNLILTSLHKTSKPISEIDFPSITICGQGSIKEVHDNVMTHQFHRYVRSKGRDPDTLNNAERDTMWSEMKEDLYPGLDQLPTFLSDTMMPNINPDSAAEALVLASGGYDACQNVDCGGVVNDAPAQCQGATTKEECEAFAIQLGLSDTTSGDVTNNFQVPSRCYYRPNNPEDKKLWFNTANVTENTSPCTQDRICVCKNGLTPFRDLLDTLRRCWHNSNSFLSKHSS